MENVRLAPQDCWEVMPVRAGSMTLLCYNREVRTVWEVVHPERRSVSHEPLPPTFYSRATLNALAAASEAQMAAGMQARAAALGLAPGGVSVTPAMVQLAPVAPPAAVYASPAPSARPQQSMEGHAQASPPDGAPSDSSFLFCMRQRRVGPNGAFCPGFGKAILRGGSNLCCFPLPSLSFSFCPFIVLPFSLCLLLSISSCLAALPALDMCVCLFAALLCSEEFFLFIFSSPFPP